MILFLLITEVILNFKIIVLRIISLIALKVMINPKKCLFTHSCRSKHVTLFLQLNVKEHILRNVSVFLSIQLKSLGANVWFPAFFKINYVPQRKSYSQVIFIFLSGKKFGTT